MQGCYVYDSNGNKYLDALAGLLSTALGMFMLSNEKLFYLQLEHKWTFGLGEHNSKTEIPWIPDVDY